MTDRPLLYPGKVLADEQSDRLFIADSNHNRIVVSTLDGKLIETIGSGLQGDNDGIFSQARFYRPQGLRARRRPSLYVADTENHQIRVVDFQARRCTRLPAPASRARGAVRAVMRCASISTRRGTSRSSPAS